MARLGRANTLRRQWFNLWGLCGHAYLELGRETEVLPVNCCEELHISDAKDLETDSGADDASFTTSHPESLLGNSMGQIPQPPEHFPEDKPWECPYGYHFVGIVSDKQWREHILRDLQPYNCIAAKCDSYERVWESCHEWITHMTSKHGIKDLHCPLCQKRCWKLKHFERHVARHLQEFAMFVLPLTEGNHKKSDWIVYKGQAATLEPRN